ncbi:hypothetical protein SEA_VINCENZO_93 [Mycobacterium phage Vincenzo]|uniref:Uncharacterized protein n=2 Tax=Coopervirus vincenzo TaxID=1983110 RepID=A0A0F6YRR5_9CAUD|nr:hypothetical protein SEA_VINCENZO_93 [Mycobacterium phage Vincenzo]AKF14355.1 hypothetical protein SEA_VINCENZO_93 [Mycobacterium phage Vincenzo]AKF14759.1 hypothetical protein SEA_ALANGRANT_94 [Mycobacterium phage AlanGrant]
MNATVLVLAFISLTGCIGLHVADRDSRGEKAAAVVALAPLMCIMILMLT